MPTTTLSDIPDKITAGDSVAWEKSFSDYPANDGWSLSYVLVNADGQITITASASGLAHLVDLASADTLGWVAGDYRYQAYVTKATERYTVDSGGVEIAANFSAATTGLDARPHCFIMRDALRAMSQDKASEDQLSLSINNRSISFLSPVEVRDWLGYYEDLCVRHERKERAEQGKPTGQQVKTRFVGS
jgi:hypothetical protein